MNPIRPLWFPNFIPNHELNNSQCRCELCQKIIRHEAKKIPLPTTLQTCPSNPSPPHPGTRRRKRLTRGGGTQEGTLSKLIRRRAAEYGEKEGQRDQGRNEVSVETTSVEEDLLGMLQELSEIERKKMKECRLRYLLPEIVEFYQGNPVLQIERKKANQRTKFITNRAKMNMFEVRNFLAQGYCFHHGYTHHPALFGRTISRSLPIVLAKFRLGSLSYQLLSYDQLDHIFKMKEKPVRTQIQYLQTIITQQINETVGSKVSSQLTEHFRRKTQGDIKEYEFKIDLKELLGGEDFPRAKRQILMMLGVITILDEEYSAEEEQILFEAELRIKDTNRYLKYFVSKLLLLDSYSKGTIGSQGVIKIILHHDVLYLWDLSIRERIRSQSIWKSKILFGYEIKLIRKIEALKKPVAQAEQDEKIRILGRNPGVKRLSTWLIEDTLQDLRDMQLIRKRIDNLELEKNALLKSQSEIEKIRNFHSLKKHL